MSELCLGCNIGFVKGPKGYKRVKVLNIASPRTAKGVFARSPQKNSFICNQCLSYLNQRTVKKVKNKQQRTLPTETKTPESTKRTKSMRTPSPTKTSPNPKKQAQSVSSPTSPIPSTSTHSPAKMNTPSPKTPSSTDSTPKISRKRKPLRSFGQGPLALAKFYLANYEYSKAFKQFLKSPVKKHLLQVCTEAINKERKTLSEDMNGPLKKTPDLREMASFSWDGVLDWASCKAPVLMACLKGIFPPLINGRGQQVKTKVRGKKTLPKYVGKGNSWKKALAKAALIREQKLAAKTLRINSQRDKKCKQRMGMALAMSMFTSNVRTNFIQKCVGIELWKQGCRQKVIKTLNHMGVSLGVDSTRRTIDTMRLGHDVKIKEWKEKAEQRKTPTSDILEPAAVDSCSSYSVTWDNVQMFVHGKHQSKDHANRFLSYGLAFAQQNKVDFSDLQGPGCRANEVQPGTVLPTPQDIQRLRERMVILVKRILVDNLAPLSKIKKKVEQHIPHKYSKEMNSKSNLVNLGVVAANPSSNAGVIEIMRFLHEYVPVVDEEPLPILCNGDGLSVQRMIGCKQLTSGARTPCQRLEGLIPTPQEFHREMLLLQDSMNMLYKSESECARGTIAQMKNDFTHRSLKKNVYANFQHAWDMMEFATSAYITLLATTFCGTSTVDDVPENLPNRVADQLSWLENLANRVVDYAWMAPDQCQIDLVAASAACPVEKSEKDFFLFCHCQEDKQEPMVKCCSSLCKIGWLHISCAGLTEVPGKDEDFFCSEECTEDGTYMYCTCKKRQGGKMVQCQMAEKCKRNEWYHTKCLMPSDAVDEDATWYCSPECEADGSVEDFVQNYSKALLWEGLNHLARRDAVREGDGPAIIASWKLDLLQFWSRNHTHYMVNGHYMLTGIGGYLPENLQSDLTWNRVANVSGRQGGNVGLDLVNEFLNNDFKEMMKRSKGKYTDKEVQRCAEMGGAFGKDLDKLLTNAGVVTLEDSWSRRDSQKRRQIQDIKEFVKEYQSDNLFANVPGRYHEGLKNFRYKNTVEKPMKMGKKMRMLAEEIDNWDVFAGLKPVM